MFKLKFFLLTIFLISSNVFARGGDDAGNGGFAFKQSVKILKMATSALEEKIKNSVLVDLVKHPERRLILQDTLGYNDLEKLFKTNRSRGGKLLAMDYLARPPKVILLKPFFVAFMGKTDRELEDASHEVQKRLLHEAAHIWGFNEKKAEEFSLAFLNNIDSGKPPADVPRSMTRIGIENFCSCRNGKSDIAKDCDLFCARKPITESPTLYIEARIIDIILPDMNIQNLHDWCTVQLDIDETSPQCALVVNDGSNDINLPILINPNSKEVTVDISILNYNSPYTLNIGEIKTGSNARSEEFSLERKK